MLAAVALQSFNPNFLVSHAAHQRMVCTEAIIIDVTIFRNFFSIFGISSVRIACFSLFGNPILEKSLDLGPFLILSFAHKHLRQHSF